MVITLHTVAKQALWKNEFKRAKPTFEIIPVHYSVFYGNLELFKEMLHDSVA